MIAELMFDTDELHPVKIDRFMTQQNKFSADLLINPKHTKYWSTIIDKLSDDK